MAGVMPINPRYTSYVYILWGLTILLLRVRGRFQSGTFPTYPPEKSASERYAWGVCLLPIALYGAHVLGLLWTEDMELGRFQLESKLALLVTPWFVWESVRDQNDEQKRRLWIRMGWAFVAGWGVHMIWVWSRFLGFYFRHELPLPWRYSKLATPFHPSYAAFYLIWAGMFLVALTAHHRRWMRLFLIPLGGHLGLLASKAGWLVGGGMLVGSAGFQRKWRHGLLIGTVLLVLMGAGFFAGSTRVSEWVSWMETQSRPETQERTGAQSPPAKTGSTGGRIQAWEAGWQLLVENPGGVGTGDLAAEMDWVYAESDADYALKKHLNPHNQWLQTGVSLGWWGLILLCLWWFGGVYATWKARQPMTFILLLILMVNALFESVLELQAGIVFAVFWVSFGVLLEPRARERFLDVRY
jgi:hypothetical protein